MSTKPNPTVIGSFALGAIALAIFAVVVFGSGDLFAHHPRAVTFFTGNMQGLRIGAAVNFRGVQVGKVTDIILRADPKTMKLTIPVYMAFDLKSLDLSSPLTTQDIAHHTGLKDLIADGLHARLASQSLVTGQLNVELDLNPDEPRTLTGGDPSTVEIPASESDLTKLKTAFTQLPLDQIANSALRVLDDVDRVVSSPEVPKLLTSLAALSENANGLIAEARADLGAVTADVNDAAHSADDTLATAKTSLTEMGTALTTVNQLMTTEIAEAVKTALVALVKAEKLMGAADGIVSVTSPQRADIDQTLRNLATTTRALRLFSEELERKPNAIVLGK